MIGIPMKGFSSQVGNNIIATQGIDKDQQLYREYRRTIL